MDTINELEKKWEIDEQVRQAERKEQLAFRDLVNQVQATAQKYKHRVYVVPDDESPPSSTSPDTEALIVKSGVDLAHLVLCAAEGQERALELLRAWDPKSTLADASSIANVPLIRFAGMLRGHFEAAKRKNIKVIGRHTFTQKVADAVHLFCGVTFDLPKMDLKNSKVAPVFVANGTRAVTENKKNFGTERTLIPEALRIEFYSSAQQPVYFLWAFCRLDPAVAIVSYDERTETFNLTDLGFALMQSRDLVKIGQVAELYQKIFPKQPVTFKSQWRGKKNPSVYAKAVAEKTFIDDKAVTDAATVLAKMDGVTPDPNAAREKQDDLSNLPQNPSAKTANSSAKAPKAPSRNMTNAPVVSQTRA